MNKPKLTFQKISGHWGTIRAHRKWVRKYCTLAGIRWRGIKHDLSKYSPTEFIESARYWTGSSSPINECKKDNGWSRAWLHHKGRNSHHYEYWMDNFDKGGEPILMPQDDFTEQVCDFLGAARVYNGDNFTFANEYLWWLAKRDKCKMHPANKAMLTRIFNFFKEIENEAKSTETADATVNALIKKGYIREVYNDEAAKAFVLSAGEKE